MIDGIVRQRILIAQFLTNILEGLIQVVHMIRIEGAAAGLLGEVLKDFVAFGEVLFAVPGFFLTGIVQSDPLRAGADGVDDHAGALGHLDGLGARVCGLVVLTIAD